jgi:membrane protein
MNNIKKACRFTLDFAAKLEQHSIAAHSAQAAFFAIISLSPFALILTRLQNNPGALLTATSVSALWAASHCMFAIIRGLNKIYSIENNRGWFKLRLLSILYTFVLQLMLLVSFTTFGFIALFGFFMFVYRVIPGEKTPIKQCLPGAVSSTVGWVGFSWLFELYVRNYADFEAVYGNLSAAVITMLWLYFCVFILFIGAEVNICFNSRKKP